MDMPEGFEKLSQIAEWDIDTRITEALHLMQEMAEALEDCSETYEPNSRAGKVLKKFKEWK